jgi:putative transposase
MKLAPQNIRTFFITAGTHQRRSLFTAETLPMLLLNLLRADREKKRYAIHEYVFMPDHIHLLLTPAPDISLEKTTQFIKGGFSFRAKKEAAFRDEVWQAGNNEHRIRDVDDYAYHRKYIWENPVRAGLVLVASEYPWSSARPGADVDPAPPGLKPDF